MEMKNYIEAAEKKAGKQTELAKILNVTTSYIRNVKAGKSGISTDMCIILANYIEADPLKVIAASNLVTEKDERKRKIFESCLNRSTTATAALIFVGVTSIVSPSPANASTDAASNNGKIYIMSSRRSNRRNQGRRFSDKLNNYVDNLRTLFLHSRNGFYKGIGSTF